MSSSSSAITNQDLQREVEQELRWDPAVALASVGVTAHNHEVTLSGTVHRYTERLAAVRAAKRIKGVHAIADDIVVEPAGVDGRTDNDIAQHAQQAMQWNIDVPDTVRATVRDGHVTLDGTVDWNFQRLAAERAVRHIAGVRGISDGIVLEHVVSPDDVHNRIATALRRSADIDANKIHVTADGGHVRLTGYASSWAERDRAQQAAWAAPGVTQVSDELIID